MSSWTSSKKDLERHRWDDDERESVSLDLNTKNRSSFETDAITDREEEVSKDEISLLKKHDSIPGDESNNLGPGQEGRPLINSKDAFQSLSMIQLLMFGLPQFNANFANYLMNSWLTYYYLPPTSSPAENLIPSAFFGTLFMCGRMLNAVCDPFFGWLSDNSRLKLGRRVPFMLFGAPFLGFAFSSIWFPPTPTETSMENVVYFCFMFGLFNVCNSFVTSPYTALLPELSSQRKERVMLATFSGLFSILGNLAGAIAGPFQSAYKDGIEFLGIRFRSSLQLMAVFAGIFHLLGFWIPLLFLKEKPRPPKPTTNLFSEIYIAFRNPAFISLIGVSCLLPMGVILVSTGLPYLCTEILERQEGEPGLVRPGQGKTWVGIISGILVGGALFWFPFIGKLSAKLGKKNLMLCSGIVMTLLIFSISIVKFFPDPAVPTIVGVVILSLPAAISFVIPNAIYGDVVDYDEQRTGVRREGVYAGAQAFCNKSALALASAIIVYFLALGDSRENSLGISMVFVIAGVIVGTGTVMFATHPIKT